LLTGNFRWEGFASVEDTASHLLGAALMGFGGVVAMGCTVGQGITGFSTLALGSIVTFLAIVAGAAATLKFQYWRLMREA
ncbi:MAG TPA: YeeE/YedE thiosulfate transporter family protein, partial [Azonexus sp.]|nr:YeeE/YedE thiosulfate transporter family protein [Azonexus sp.]